MQPKWVKQSKISKEAWKEINQYVTALHRTNQQKGQAIPIKPAQILILMDALLVVALLGLQQEGLTNILIGTGCSERLPSNTDKNSPILETWFDDHFIRCKWSWESIMTQIPYQNLVQYEELSDMVLIGCRDPAVSDILGIHLGLLILYQSPEELKKSGYICKNPPQYANIVWISDHKKSIPIERNVLFCWIARENILQELWNLYNKTILFPLLYVVYFW